MNPAFIVDQVKVGRSAEGSLRSIREMMKLTLFDLTKILLKGLKILPATDRIPLRVGGLELIQTLKRNESATTPHCSLKPH